ncbi:MAG: hypothetical protein U0670_23935 [Anaerolineae bacterium]
MVSRGFPIDGQLNDDIVGVRNRVRGGVGIDDALLLIVRQHLIAGFNLADRDFAVRCGDRGIRAEAVGIATARLESSFLLSLSRIFVPAARFIVACWLRFLGGILRIPICIFCLFGTDCTANYRQDQSCDVTGIGTIPSNIYRTDIPAPKPPTAAVA